MKLKFAVFVVLFFVAPVLAWADLNGSEIHSVSGATGWTLQSTVSIGATSIVVTGGTGAPVVGDAFCMTATCLSGMDKAGHVVTAVSGVGPYTLTVSPPMGYWWYVGTNRQPSGETLTAGTAVNFRVTVGANAGACATPSDKTTLAVGWVTTNASDSYAIIGRDYVGQPEFHGPYDATPVTTHCINITHLFPALANYISGGLISSTYDTVGTYSIFIGSHRSSGCVGTACDSTAFGPIAVLGVNSPGMGLQVTTPQALTTDPLSWDFYPTPGAHNVYKGNPLRVQMLYAQKGGKVGFSTNSNYQMVQTGAAVDGVACTMGNPPVCSGHLVPAFIGSQWGGGAYPCGVEANLICQYDAGKTGYFLLGTTGFGYLAGLMPIVQVNTDSSTTVGPHSVDVTLRPYDSAGTPVGAAQTYTISFNVLAVPTPPSQTLQPVSFPAIYNQGVFLGNSFWQGWEWCYANNGGFLSDFNYLYPLGNQYWVYFNAYSRVWNYDGLRNYRNMAELIVRAQASPVVWQALHSYNYGDIITPSLAQGNAGGFSYIAINSTNNGTPGNSGTSAASHPTWPQTPTSTSAAAMQVTDGSVIWFNIGNYASQVGCATNSDYPWRSQIIASHAGTTEEANQIGAFGLLMDKSATGDVQTHSALANPNATALGYLASSSNRQHNYLVYLDFQDSRLPFYNLSNYIASEMAGQAHQSEANYLLDTMFNYADQIANCDQTTWSVGTCLKGFYVGLTLEQITAYCEMKLSQGATCDPRTYDAVRAVLDKLWSVWCPAGGAACSNLSSYTQNTLAAFPYAGNGEWPLTSANTNLTFVELNNLVCDAYAWLWSKVGDNWKLPDAVTTYREAGDLCFGHSYDNLGNYGNYGKEFNQNRAGWNYINWRNGTNVKVKTISGTDYAYSPLNEWPENVTVVGAAADVVPPYHFWYNPGVLNSGCGGTPYTPGSYPDTCPPVMPTNASSANVWWTTYEEMSPPEVCVSLSATMSSPVCFTGTSTQSSLCGHASLAGTQMWNNCVTASSLLSSTTYYYTVGGTDLSGNTAKSSPGTGGAGPNSTFSFTVGATNQRITGVGATVKGTVVTR